MDAGTEIAALEAAALDGPGETQPAERHAVAGGEAGGSPYLAKVAAHAYRVTDADVEALRATGRSEDEIFELTVAAATGAGLSRLEAALAALRDA